VDHTAGVTVVEMGFAGDPGYTKRPNEMTMGGLMGRADYP